jgi:hypothetical protein
VNESQLQDAVIKQEKLEARNLDYPGKAVIAKQALVRKSLLEIAMPDPQGGEFRVFGTPTALVKNGGETILVLRPQATDPKTETRPPEDSSQADVPAAGPAVGLVRIPLGKISLIRRIKQSLFEE